VVIFGELMHGFHCRFRIDGFSSQTRNNCDFLTVKTFDDTWNASKDRLGALKSAGYTRIGPALRHATHELKQEDSRNRWILLLSDGKPNDFDRYEGRYGIEDVREAIREAQHFGIHHYALAVDRGARFYLPRMFGHQQFQIMNHPHQLVEALSDFFIKVYRLP
jgi:nitric oxide reductase NorD protein